MDIQVRETYSLDDGGYEVCIEMDAEAKKFLLAYMIKTILIEAVELAKQEIKDE